MEIKKKGNIKENGKSNIAPETIELSSNKTKGFHVLPVGKVALPFLEKLEQVVSFQIFDTRYQSLR